MLIPRAMRQRSDAAWVLGTVIVLAALAALLGNIVSGTDTEGARGVVLIVLVVLGSIALFYRITRDDPDRQHLYRLLLAALALKLGAVWFRLWLIYAAYGGSADALQYHNWGSRMAGAILEGNPFDVVESGGHGTNMVRIFTALFYSFTGPTLTGAFVFWAFLGLLGMFFFYRAFTTAFPNGNRRLFSLLIFLYPSMLLWTSSLGKDALACFALGMLTYGAARLFRAIETKGILLAGVGMVLLLSVRPHIAAISGVAIVMGTILRPIRAGLMTPVLRLGGIVVFAGLAAVVIQTSASYVNLEDLSSEGISTFIEERQEATERGGAVIERGGVPTNPIAFLDGVLTVLFRPYPWEAHNPVAMIAAAEGVALLVLFIYRRQSVWAAIKGFRRQSMLAVALSYIVLFAFFFSAISNYAIIARQRHQILPFLFIWLAYLPPVPPRRP